MSTASSGACEHAEVGLHCASKVGGVNTLIKTTWDKQQTTYQAAIPIYTLFDLQTGSQHADLEVQLKARENLSKLMRLIKAGGATKAGVVKTRVRPRDCMQPVPQGIV